MIGTLIGVVKMLQNMDDPSAIGPAMAVALLTLLYGILLGEIVFKSMATDLIRKHHTHLERNSQRGRVHTYAALLTVILLVGCVFAMMMHFT
jgi:Na+/glutamate symporter